MMETGDAYGGQAAWQLPGSGDGALPGFDGDASVLQLLQQQAVTSQQQQSQQQQQQQGQADCNSSFAAPLEQHQQAVPMVMGAYAGQPMVGAAFPQQFQPAFVVPRQVQFQLGQQPAAYGSTAAAGMPFFPAGLMQQHQQAAMARQGQQQAQAQTSGSVASNGLTNEMLAATAAGALAQQQPRWALPQHQAANGGPMVPPLPCVPVSLAGGGGGAAAHRRSGSSSGGAVGPTASDLMQKDPTCNTSAPGGTRRRGRQPKDPSTLTEKQLRAREAQKRFREKQKNMMAETQAAVGRTSAELDRLRIANESQKLKNEVLERLLQFKEAQVHALEFQKQMDPPPRFVISPDMVDMMRREGIAGLFTPDVLLRYSVAGYTEHMDERGEVKDPPPFEKVAEDWSEIVELVKSILDSARQSGDAAAPAVPDTRCDAAALATIGVRAAREARPSEVEELGSGGSGSGSSISNQQQRQRQRLQGDSTGRSSSSQQRGWQGEVRQPEQTALSSHALEAAGGGAAAPMEEMAAGCPVGEERAGSASSGEVPEPAGAAACRTRGGGMGSAFSGRIDPAQIPEHVKPELVAIAEEAPDAVLEVAQAKDDPIARFVLARILSQTAAHSHLQWDTLVEGAVVKDGPFSYRFTGQQLRALAGLMRRVGLMLWQQALLFPHHITKLGTLRLDDPGNLCVEEQHLDRWRSIMRKLHCRPEQLRKIVAGHQRYIERMQPVMEERKEAVAEVQRMTEFQMLHMFDPSGQGSGSTQEFLQRTTRLTDATGLVMQTVSAQHAAYCELLIAIFYALTFPVQRPMLLVLSWPYFPQLELIGQAAALELGLDISQYPTYSSDARALHD